MGARLDRTRRALHVGRVARRSGIRRVLAEVGVVGSREATREGARKFREALEELGTTYIKLGQLLSSRPDLLPDVYIEELGHLVDEVPPVPFEQIRRVIDEETVKKVLDVQRFSFGIPASPASAEFTQAWTDAVNRVLAGQQSPAQALNQAQKEAVAAIKAATR